MTSFSGQYEGTLTGGREAPTRAFQPPADNLQDVVDRYIEPALTNGTVAVQIPSGTVRVWFLPPPGNTIAYKVSTASDNPGVSPAPGIAWCLPVTGVLQIQIATTQAFDLRLWCL